MTAAEGRLWGARFAAAPDAAAWALGRSVAVDGRLWREDLAGSRAHADELHRVGVLSAADHAALHGALAAVGEELAAGTFRFEPGDEDLHGAVERRLVELLGETGGRLRAGRSRNDQIASDLRRWVVGACGRLVAGIRAVQRALADQAEATADWIAPGYTHLQRAQPVTLGHHLLAHAWALDRDAGRLRDAAGRAAVEPLGSGALAGLTLPLDPARYAAALGVPAVAPNSMDAVADRDFAVEFLAACALTGVHLSRLGEEVVLWSSAEFGWARVGDAFSTGSSIMPQKRNPVPIEHMRHLAAVTAGRCDTMVDTMRNTPFTDMNDSEGEVQQAGYAAFESGGRMLELAAAVVHAARIDGDRVRRNADAACITITELADTLVRDEGLTFRAAHEIAARTARAVIARGVPLGEGFEAFRAAFAEAAGRGTAMDTATFATTVAPGTFVARRNRPGGPAPAALDAAFVSYAATLDALRARTAVRAGRHAAAERSLLAAFSSLTEA